MPFQENVALAADMAIGLGAKLAEDTIGGLFSQFATAKRLKSIRRQANAYNERIKTLESQLSREERVLDDDARKEMLKQLRR